MSFLFYFLFFFPMIHPTILAYNEQLSADDQLIAQLLATQIDSVLADAESKIRHAHPVRFLAWNPIVGYSKLKNSVRLLFWSGQSFPDSGLDPEGSFKAAEKRYTHVDQVDTVQLQQWLKQSKQIQRNYKDIVKNKGQLAMLP
jgi:hypothetical protein